MRFGISTASFYTRYETEDAITIIGSLGVDTCEVFLGSSSEFGEAFGRVLARRAQDAGVCIGSIHGMSTMYEPQLFSEAKRQRQDAFDMLDAVLDCAAEAGATTYVFHGPPQLKPLSGPFNHRKLAETAVEIEAHIRNRGLTMSWETVYYCPYRAPDFLPRLLEQGGPPCLRATLDIKQAKLSGHSPLAYAGQMGSRMNNLHLSDWDQRGNICLPGRGTAPLGSWLSALRDMGYNGPAILEVYRDSYGEIDELQRCIQWLKELEEAGGM